MVKQAHRAELLEKMLSSQMDTVEGKKDVYACKTNPVFAIQASMASQGIKITEGGSAGNNRDIQNNYSRCPPGDKGKKKMFVEDESGPSLAGINDGNGLCHLPNDLPGPSLSSKPNQSGPTVPAMYPTPGSSLLEIKEGSGIPEGA